MSQAVKSLPRELKTEVIVGWRCWNFIRPHFLADLAGEEVIIPYQRLCASHTRWSRVEKDDCKSPETSCSCGIYAYEEEESLQQQRKEHLVYGKVALWGKVIKHKLGYRAQYAYPLELFVHPGTPMSFQILLGATYGVPCSERVWFPDRVNEGIKPHIQEIKRLLLEADSRVARFTCQTVGGATILYAWTRNMDLLFNFTVDELRS